MREVHTTDVAGEVVRDLVDLIERQSPATVHIALTGGRVGALVTGALLRLAGGRRNLHVWFSDERYLPTGDPERNDAAVPDGVIAHVHRVPGPDESADATDAARQYMAQLHQETTTRFCADNTMMDVTVLSIGPDGHIASLFPHSSQLESPAAVAAVTDSPKPPAQRVTWTLPTINASRQVWLLASGEEKADAVASVLAGARTDDVPAAGVIGRQETRLYTDISR